MAPGSGSDPDPRLGEGRRFGDYRILRAIGSGGMGEVYEAAQEQSGRRVALKIMGRSEDRAPRPLPRAWLPDPSPPEGAPMWNTRVERILERPAAFPEPPQSSLSLSLMAVKGDPVALWEGFGIQADPVLALIAFQGQGDGTGQGMPLTSPEREDR